MCAHKHPHCTAHPFPAPLFLQAFRTQLGLFMAEVRSHSGLPQLKQHLLLYSSIDLQVGAGGHGRRRGGAGRGTWGLRHAVAREGWLGWAAGARVQRR